MEMKKSEILKMLSLLDCLASPHTKVTIRESSNNQSMIINQDEKKRLALAMCIVGVYCEIDPKEFENYKNLLEHKAKEMQ